MPTKNLIIYTIALALVFFSLGLFINNLFSLSPNKINQPAPGISQNTFQAGWEAARQRLKDTGFFPALTNQEVKEIYGQIKEIKDNKITLKIGPLEPLADPQLDMRTIEIDNQTKIYKLEAKDQTKFQQEMAEYNKLMEQRVKNPAAATTSQPIMPPSLYTNKPISLSDLKVGMQITVSADNNIKDSQEFKAVEINIQFEPSSASPVIPPLPVKK